MSYAAGRVAGWRRTSERCHTTGALWHTSVEAVQRVATRNIAWSYSHVLTLPPAASSPQKSDICSTRCAPHDTWHITC